MSEITKLIERFNNEANTSMFFGKLLTEYSPKELRAIICYIENKRRKDFDQHKSEIEKLGSWDMKLKRKTR